MKQISKSNKTFIKNAIISDKKRIDLRKSRQNRELSITFGHDFGTCYVRLGQTILFTKTSCEVTEPKISRPNEGLIELSLDLCSAAEKWLDSYQRALPQEGIHCLRLLERTIKDSRCVDTESLCLIAGEKVWKIKCHIVCLNFDGNLCEAASIAAITSLAHFKRPEVSITAEKKIKVHTFDEKTPLSLTLLHYPFCVSFVFFFDDQERHHILCDPQECEEESADASLVIAANSYQEIVSLHCAGKPVVNSETILNCSQIAIERAKYLTEFVKNAQQEDKQTRSKDIESIGFASAIRTGDISNIQKPILNILNVMKVDKVEEEEPLEETPVEETQNIYLYGRGIAGIGEGGKSQWKFETSQESEESNDEILPLVVEPNQPKVEIKSSPKRKAKANDSDDEEDEVMILETVGFDRKVHKK